LELLVQPDLVEVLERGRMVAAGARHLVEEVIIRHRLDQRDGDVLLRQRQRQAKTDRSGAHHDDGVRPQHVPWWRYRYFCGTTSFTAPAQPVWVRSNTRPVGALYLAS